MPGRTDERWKGGRWSDLGLRVLSAIVLAPIALGGAWMGGGAWLAVVSGASVGLAVEWSLLTRHAWAGHRLSRAQRVITGLFYFAPTFAALLWLRADPAAGLGNTAFLMLVVWASDVGAYGAGRSLGGPLLAPQVSPGKTWSGVVGGLCAAAAVGAVFAPQGAMAGLLLGAVAQAGDLAESAVKRGFGVKDSGRIIPGHGGFLDRLDGLLAAAPVAAGLSVLSGTGMPLWG